MQPLTSSDGKGTGVDVDRKPSFTTFQKPTNLPLKRYSSPKAEPTTAEEMDF
uniref:Uncharacterized protein n=1 Tax=Romanomermis culicivorax TaxID=13658 RepID=A0A915HWS6_ROMCU